MSSFLFQHCVCGYLRFHGSLLAVHSSGTREDAERVVCPLRQPGRREPLPADQDSRRLLLLRIGTTGSQSRSCAVCRRHGTGHDRGYRVSMLYAINNMIEAIA